MKLAYGDHQKVKFYAEYQRFFEFYSVSFIVCRFILAPVVLLMFLSSIKEDIYYYIILSSSIFIIIGSLMWMIGQCRMIYKIKKTKE